MLPATSPYPGAWSSTAAGTWSPANRAASALLLDGVAPELLEPPVNVLRLSLHPDGHGAADRQPRRVARAPARAPRAARSPLTGDAALRALLRRGRGLPGAAARAGDRPGGDIVVPLRLRAGDGGELAFFSTIATFGTAVDITVAELSIESFFPADAATAAAVRDAVPT